jgi:hypothetical protein
MTHTSHRMLKHKFGITFPNTLFVESVLAPFEHEKLCVDVSHRGLTGMHYVTRRYHRMQKHKFGVRCPDTLFVKSVPVPPEQKKNSASTFRAPDAPPYTS